MTVGDEGQYLIINQRLDLVTVFVSTLTRSDFFVPYNIYVETILAMFGANSIDIQAQ